MPLQFHHPEVKEEDCSSGDRLAKGMDADSDSSTGSFHSADAYAGRPMASDEVYQQAQTLLDGAIEHQQERPPAIDAFQTLRRAVLTASFRLSTTESRKGVPIPCACIEPLRYCQCLGTGYVRVCSDCPGIDCKLCSGAGVVPEFPVQPGIEITDVLQRRGAPPGLRVMQDWGLPPAAITTAEDHIQASSKSKTRRPSLRDIVLSRHWRDQEHSAPRSEPQPEPQPIRQSLRDVRHQPYYIQTPESLTLVLDGPRPSDLELDLPSLIVDQPLLPALPLHHYINGPPSWQAWTGFSSLGTQEQEWDIFSATRDDPCPNRPPTIRPRHRRVRDWLEEVDEDGPIPHEYRARLAKGSM